MTNYRKNFIAENSKQTTLEIQNIYKGSKKPYQVCIVDYYGSTTDKYMDSEEITEFINN
jgi:hypothetical protein